MDSLTHVNAHLTRLESYVGHEFRVPFSRARASRIRVITKFPGVVLPRIRATESENKLRYVPRRRGIFTALEILILHNSILSAIRSLADTRGIQLPPNIPHSKSFSIRGLKAEFSNKPKVGSRAGDYPRANIARAK